MFDLLEADIVVMQETKIQRKDLTDDMVLVPGWDVYFSLPRHKKGYSGVAIYTRNATCAPIRAEEGILGVLCPPKLSTQFRNLPKDQQIGGYPRPEQLPGNIDELLLDSEGRCVVLEFPAFVLLGVYSPANRDESRVEFRMEFLQALDARVRNLVAQGKQVILVGDLNVSRSEADSTNVVENLRKEGMSLEEWMNLPSRRLFNHLVYGGTVQGDRDQERGQPVLWDLCREYHPAREGMNTCWDTKRNTRPANNGSRIDYVLCSDGLKDWFTEANIQEGLMGSDHCPVFATLADVVMAGIEKVPLLNLVNPPGMVDREGRRLRQWHPKDVLPLSAKLIPEFDRRQSIRDMFTRKAGAKLENHASSLAPSSATESTPEREPTTYELGMSGASQSKSCTELGQDAPSTKRAAGLVDPARQSPKRSKVVDTGVDANRGVVEKQAATNSRAGKGQKTLRGFFQPSSIDRMMRKKDSDITTTEDLPDSGSMLPAKPGLEAPTHSAEADRVFDPIQAKESWSKLLGKRMLPRCEHGEPCISLTTKRPGVNCGMFVQLFFFARPPLYSSLSLASSIYSRDGSSIWRAIFMLFYCHMFHVCRTSQWPTLPTGRSFYICARPLGPSGDKERGSEWRCGTFIWSSDWNGPPS
uniref:APN2 n=1 Tax=Trichoderma spinulosum TaxID=1491020 RepID=A0A223FZ68_TRISN|nr:APN2 [Trichoderma spinulosum]AST15027.1 APN2 [Trichoderma spinulosum]